MNASATTISVDAKALAEVLAALQGPKHMILELMSARRLAPLGFTSPIDVLIKDMAAAQPPEKYNSSPQWRC